METTDHRVLTLWACECDERVVERFESAQPMTTAPAGRSANGWVEWNDPAGRTLKDSEEYPASKAARGMRRAGGRDSRAES